MAVQPTMVPYLWRRHLGVLRVVIGCFCVLLYLLRPQPYNFFTLAVVGAYALYSTYVILREQIETREYRLPVLLLDLMFFFVCALHPSNEGLWLSSISYFYLICHSTLLYEWKHVAGTVLICVTFFIVVGPAPASLLWPTVLMAGVFATVFAIQREAFQNRLSMALRRSVLSRSEAESAREAERQRIAADFHDGPLQSFISFQMRLEIIRRLIARDHDAALKELVQLQELGQSQVTELRSFLHNMQPLEIEDGGLPSSIRELVGTFERDTGISVNLACGELNEPDDTGFATEVLQVIREALNNVRKHSKASRVSLNVECEDSAMAISIADDGSGFPFSGTFSLDELEVLRIGPRSIKRRIRTLNGDLTLESKPSQGSGLKIRIPV